MRDYSPALLASNPKSSWGEGEDKWVGGWVGAGGRRLVVASSAAIMLAIKILLSNLSLRRSGWAEKELIEARSRQGSKWCGGVGWKKRMNK